MKLIKHFFCGISLLFGLPFTASAQPGSLDSSFDFDGKVITSVGNSDVRIFDATIQYDGKIVVAGSYGSLTACDFILAKYKVNGSLDSSFGSNGVVIVSFSNSRDVIWSLVLQPDQKILVAGETENASKDFIIARYTNNGALDSTFGINGKVILDFNGNYDYAESVVIDTINQKIYAGGLSSPSMGANAKMALARLNIDGSLDNSYNGNGKLLIDLQTSSNEKINCIYVQTDGKLLIAGHSNPSVTLMTIIRLDTLGQFDSTFSSTGIFVDNNINSSVNSIANDYNGKIVAGGLVGVSNSADFAIWRLNNNGTLDNTFNGTGFITIPFNTNAIDAIYKIGLQADNKIVAAGSTGNAFGSYNYALARVDSMGILDGGFGNGGKAITDFTGSDDLAFAIAIQPDLKIVAAGETWQNGKWNFSLARYFSGLNVGVIDEPAEHFELSAYPNPASNYINLNYELTNNATVSIAVYDVMGKRIKSYVHNETKIKGMQAEALAVDDLKKGVYILRIETDRAQRGVRFVKN